MYYKKLIGITAVALLLTVGANMADAQTTSSSSSSSSTSSSSSGGIDTSSTSSGGLGSSSTSSSGVGSGSTTTPGVPNTGTGGDAAMNLALMASSGIIGLLGATYLIRSRRTMH